MASHPVAICILYREDKLLMQLRDNIPTILYPGLWGLFGGHVEAGETPEVAVGREITEEIAYQLPPAVPKFGIYADERVERHVFYSPLAVPVPELTLLEGWDLKLLDLAEIKSGQAFSVQAGQDRPIGPVHQQILLDFWQRHGDLLEIS